MSGFLWQHVFLLNTYIHALTVVTITAGRALLEKFKCLQKASMKKRLPRGDRGGRGSEPDHGHPDRPEPDRSRSPPLQPWTDNDEVNRVIGRQPSGLDVQTRLAQVPRMVKFLGALVSK